jgi:hypothetical protein
LEKESGYQAIFPCNSEKKLQLPTIHSLHHQHYKEIICQKISHVFAAYLK